MYSFITVDVEKNKRAAIASAHLLAALPLGRSGWMVRVCVDWAGVPASDGQANSGFPTLTQKTGEGTEQGGRLEMFMTNDWMREEIQGTPFLKK